MRLSMRLVIGVRASGLRRTPEGSILLAPVVAGSGSSQSQQVSDDGCQYYHRAFSEQCLGGVFYSSLGFE